MTAPDLVLNARRIVTPEGIIAGHVAVANGRIVSVGSDPVAEALEAVDIADDCVLLPGLVDSHVHVNEPGRAEWEGFATATSAAAAGGVTTVVDMPLNSIPPTVDLEALAAKRRAAESKLSVDVALWGGAIPGNLDDLAPLHEAGVVGFKCFLLPSGVDEFPPLEPHQLKAAMTRIAAFGGLLIAHCESGSVIDAAPPAGGPSYSTFVASRPPEAEVDAVAMLLEAAAATGCRTHIVHVSAAAVVPMIAAAKERGLPLTAETCPHYLTLTAGQVPNGATEFKCCPPIRDAANQERLWAALADGAIDLIVSDHSPCTPELKDVGSGDFGAAWGGISSLQLSLPIVWTAAAARGFGLGDIARWMSSAPARLTQLDAKGAIAVGRDADFAIFAPDEKWTVDPSRLRHRHHLTPYAGANLQGMVRESWLRGRRIFPNATESFGRILTRGSS